jgi:hypothetical protein
MPGEAQQRLGHLVRRQHKVNDAGADGAARHALEAGGLGLLHKHDAAFGLDEAQAERAVGARAREDDRDRTLALILGERAEEGIDRGRCPRGALGLFDRTTPSRIVSSWSGAIT